MIEVIQLDINKDWFCVRYNGVLIIGTQREVESVIRNDRLDDWIRHLTTAST